MSPAHPLTHSELLQLKRWNTPTIYNGWELTQSCLEHLRRQTVPHTAIVCDNGSTDGSPERLRGSFPEVRVVELVRDERLTPANTEAEAVRDSLLKQGVLVGVGGVYGNVIRIQPPLVISRKQLDNALDVVEKGLAEVAGQRARAAS